MSKRTNKRPQIERYKYRLLILLRRLPVEDNEIAWEFLPERLRINRKTLRNWQYILAGEKREIPARAILQLAAFFNIEPKDIYTTPPDTTTLVQEFEQVKTTYYGDYEKSTC